VARPLEEEEKEERGEEERTWSMLLPMRAMWRRSILTLSTRRTPLREQSIMTLRARRGSVSAVGSE